MRGRIIQAALAVAIGYGFGIGYGNWADARELQARAYCTQVSGDAARAGGSASFRRCLAHPDGFQLAVAAEAHGPARLVPASHPNSARPVAARGRLATSYGRPLRAFRAAVLTG